MDPNKLCPKGWAWLIGNCGFISGGGDCDDCGEPLAPASYNFPVVLEAEG